LGRFATKIAGRDWPLIVSEMIFSHTTLRCLSLTWLAAMAWQPGVAATAKTLTTGFEQVKPFAFRVEQFADGKWVEIFNGDRAVVVGRSFKSRVEIPLKINPVRLRFTCTSPERSGILTDDVALIPAAPQKIASVTVDDVQVPVLMGLETNPLLRAREDLDAHEAYQAKLTTEVAGKI